MTPTSTIASRPSSAQCEDILARARSLARRSDLTVTGRSLRGRRIGMLCRPDTESAVLLRDAAEALGAKVAAVGPMWEGIDDEGEARRTASVIGRFYDAVECEGMPAHLSEAFRGSCPAIVFEGLASGDHPIARLADRLNGGIPLRERQRLVVQGALLTMLC